MSKIDLYIFFYYIEPRKDIENETNSQPELFSVSGEFRLNSLDQMSSENIILTQEMTESSTERPKSSTSTPETTSTISQTSTTSKNSETKGKGLDQFKI